MTIGWGDTGKPLTGVLRTLTCTQPSPRESLSGTPTALPTSNPGSASAQVSFTVQQSDLPTMPGVVSNTYSAYIIVGGKNTDAASQTVNSQLYQNGTSKGTANCVVATNTFWTHTLYFTSSVVVGDVITVSLWSTSANMNYDYTYFMVFMSRVLPTKRQAIMTSLSLTVNSDVVPTLGTPNQAVTSFMSVYPLPTNNCVYNPATGTFSLDTLKASNTTYNLVCSYFDTGASYTATDATYRPKYRQPTYLKTITFREIGRY